ncbi:uncharacterized protein LOC143239339 [Tachypleus tridentatus]|uniref:uncharacterized protein LOC143239339 n=1 Tax=Tachypleus tridentatus TaxID=6853 RepID=UPI003FD00AF3
MMEILPADDQNSVFGKYYANGPRKDTWGFGRYQRDVLFKQTTEVLNGGNYTQEHLKRQYIVHPSLPIHKQTTFRNPSTLSSYQDNLNLHSVSDSTVVCAQDKPLLKSSSIPGVQQTKTTTKVFTSHKRCHHSLSKAEATAMYTKNSIGRTTKTNGKYTSSNKKTATSLEQLSTPKQLLQCRYLRLTPSNIKTLLEQSNEDIFFHPHMTNVDSYTVVFGL